MPNNYYVKFYQHPLDVRKGGKNVTMKVNDKGQATPIDEFEKYGLQDEITVIEYHLPKSVKLVCYTERFFKNRRKWYIGIRYKCEGGKCTWQPAIDFGRFANLALDGTGTRRIIELHKHVPAYADKIRSAKILKK